MKVITDDIHYKNIADAIRQKLFVRTKFKPKDMATAILRIINAHLHIDVQPLSISRNGTYSAPKNWAFNPVTVSVNSHVALFSRSFLANGQYRASVDGQVYPAGYSHVTVRVPITEYSISQFYTSSNGVFQAAQGYAFNPVTVSIPTYRLMSAFFNHNVNDYAPNGYLYGNVEVSVPGKDNTMLEKLIMHSFSYSYSNSQITRIRGRAFISRTTGGELSFPNVEEIGEEAFVRNSITRAEFSRCRVIGDGAFNACTLINEVSFPLCEYIGKDAFHGCVRIAELSFPECSYIGSSAFYGCSSLSNVSFPKVKVIGCSIFGGTSVSVLNFPMCESIPYDAFAYFVSLTSISFPVCTHVGSYAFRNCTNLESAVLPECSFISQCAFETCTQLSLVSIPKCTALDQQVFNGCTRLISLYLGASEVVSIYTSFIFNSTPIAGYSAVAGRYGSIFVPTSLISEYQSARYWSYFSSRFVAFN